MLVLLTVRSLQVSVPILLIMKLRNVSWSDYGFVGFRKLIDILIAVGLVVLCYCTYYGSAIILYNCGVDFSGDYDGIPVMTADASISLGSIVLIFVASAANGLAEELAIRSYPPTNLHQDQEACDSDLSLIRSSQKTNKSQPFLNPATKFPEEPKNNEAKKQTRRDNKNNIAPSFA